MVMNTCQWEYVYKCMHVYNIYTHYIHTIFYTSSTYVFLVDRFTDTILESKPYSFSLAVKVYDLKQVV